MRREKTIHLNWSQTSNPNALNKYLGCLEESKKPGSREKKPGFRALGGTRTPNLLIRSQMLYPLSYKRVGLICFLG